MLNTGTSVQARAACRHQRYNKQQQNSSALLPTPPCGKPCLSTKANRAFHFFGTTSKTEAQHETHHTHDAQYSAAQQPQMKVWGVALLARASRPRDRARSKQKECLHSSARPSTLMSEPSIPRQPKNSGCSATHLTCRPPAPAPPVPEAASPQSAHLLAYGRPSWPGSGCRGITPAAAGQCTPSATAACTPASAPQQKYVSHYQWNTAGCCI